MKVFKYYSSIKWLTNLIFALNSAVPTFIRNSYCSELIQIILFSMKICKYRTLPPIQPVLREDVRGLPDLYYLLLQNFVSVVQLSFVELN